MKRSTIRSLMSAGVGIVTFIVTMLIKMPIYLCGPLAILMYFAFYYLTKGKVVFGQHEVDLSLTQEEFDALMSDMVRDIDVLEKVSRNAPNEDVRREAKSLYDTSMSIVKYLQWKPDELENMKEFFVRDLSDAADISTSYMRFMDMGVESSEVASIHERTRDSMIRLKQRFAKNLGHLTREQMDDFMNMQP